MPIKIANRLKMVQPSPTLTISNKANEMIAEGFDVVNFGVGEPDFNTPEYIKRAAIEAIEANFTRYTANAGIPELRRAICDKLYQDNQLKYEPKQILVSPGAKAAILNVLIAVCDVQDQVLMPAPYWVSYPYQAILANAEPVIIPTQEENAYKLTALELEEAIKTHPCSKVLLLNSPNNPTGAVYAKKRIGRNS
jgi:aspartate aminotransferase